MVMEASAAGVLDHAPKAVGGAAPAGTAAAVDLHGCSVPMTLAAVAAILWELRGGCRRCRASSPELPPASGRPLNLGTAAPARRRRRWDSSSSRGGGGTAREASRGSSPRWRSSSRGRCPASLEPRRRKRGGGGRGGGGRGGGGGQSPREMQVEVRQQQRGRPVGRNRHHASGGCGRRTTSPGGDYSDGAGEPRRRVHRACRAGGAAAAGSGDRRGTLGVGDCISSC